MLILYRLFIDGAHTMESLEVCINWFKEHTSIRNSKKCLLFNTTGDRNSNQMLDFLHSQFKFDVALFSPNVATHSIDLKGNSYKLNAFVFTQITVLNCTLYIYRHNINNKTSKQMFKSFKLLE